MYCVSLRDAVNKLAVPSNEQLTRERISCLPGTGAQVLLAADVPLDACAAVEAALGDAHVGLQESFYFL